MFFSTTVENGYSVRREVVHHDDCPRWRPKCCSEVSDQLFHKREYGIATGGVVAVVELVRAVHVHCAHDGDAGASLGL